jgi:hypothetical protein
MTRGYLVSWMRGAAAVGLLSIAAAAGAQPKPPEGGSTPDAYYEEVAARFGALHELSGRLSSPDAVRELVGIMVKGDAAGFNAFLDELKLPLTGKCWWAHDMIDTVMRTSGDTEEVCTLREDLTPQERFLYIVIAARYGQLTGGKTGGFHVVGVPMPIPPGPFLDELKAAGLVKCTQRPKESDSLPIAGKPYYFCLGDPR